MVYSIIVIYFSNTNTAPPRLRIPPFPLPRDGERRGARICDDGTFREERVREPARLALELCSGRQRPYISSPVFARDVRTNEHPMNSPRLKPPETEANKFRLLEDNVACHV